MKSLTTLVNLYTNLSNNTSVDNQVLGTQLISDRDRDLNQKYFDNERSSTTTTVGAMNLTLTGTLAIAAVSATLTAVWTYPTCQQYVNFSGGQQRLVTFTIGSAAITWSDGLTATATTAISTVGVQGYKIPANISKLKDVTINVGQLKYLPVEVMTRREWDAINYLPYTSDIVNYFFIYNSEINFFPIPSTTGNIITYNYKRRTADLSVADYSTGTLAAGGMVVGSVTVTGLGTGWNSVGLFPLTVLVGFENLYIRANVATGGDGFWYKIRNFVSDTVLTLENPVVNAPNITASTTYTIGQFPLIEEDFQDMLVWGALRIYFSSIKPDSTSYKMYDQLYKDKIDLLEDYLGTKTAMSVDLGAQPMMQNPNLFIFGPTSTP